MGRSVTRHQHVPVLLDRVGDLFAPSFAHDRLVADDANRRDTVFVDGTLGLGGHAEALLTRFDDLVLIGVDRDPEAISRATERLAPFGDRAMAVNAVYDQIPEVITNAGFPAVSGILFDLGVSSLQLDAARRGFAYSQDAPLDMRMNPTSGLSAADIVNTYPAAELTRILREYGEERFASRVAAAIVNQRADAPFTSSARLVDVVRDAIPAAARRTGGNPSKRTFQALRIEVNDELRTWRRALPAALDCLEVGGRLVVLAYHSLEDRITKQVFASVSTTTAPRDLPIVPPELAPRFRLITRGAEKASDAEIAENRRARSVRLRAVERIAA